MRLYKAWQQGDTIVEVMISMAVLAVVLGATYSISTRSYQSGLNAQYRDQAVSYAQQQVELIREADNNKPSTISAYTSPADTAFCIDPNTKSRLTGNSCLFGNLYSVSTQYRAASRSFQVTTSWDSASSVKQQIVIYYKPNDSFVGTPVACTAENESCTGILINAPGVAVSASASPIDIGRTVTINWDTTNIVAGSCTASGPGGFSSADVSPSAGNYTTSPLTTPGDNVFSVTCKDNAGHDVVGSTTVVVNPPAVTSFKVNGVSGPNTINISYKNQVTVSWSASNVTRCTASGPWSTGGATSGSITTGRLASNSTFGLTCTTSSGSTISAPSINVNVGPSGIYSYYYQGADFNNGGWGPYHDGQIDWCALSGCDNGWLSVLRSRANISEASCVSVYWVGQILADTNGTYKMETLSDDGIRLSIDGNRVIDNWTQHSATYNSNNVFLSSGWHSVQVWYQNNNGNGCFTGDDHYAAAQLIWTGPGGGSRNQVPQDHLRPY